MRTRSEYRASIGGRPFDRTPGARAVADADSDELAVLLIAAYSGTVDDEGESMDDAREVIDGGDRALSAMSFVVVVDGRHYVDPVAVLPIAKRRGLGRAAVATSLASLAAAGVTEVGATITDGNIASERLFASLGFERTGAW